MAQQLPTYFVIKRDSNNKLWSKYIDWLNEYFNISNHETLKGHAYGYYGYDGCGTRNGVNFSDRLTGFKNNPEIITLETWNNIVYPSINKLTYGGQIADFPVEIVEKMLEHQVAQGNKRDVSVFEHKCNSGNIDNGFAWATTPEKFIFWSEVILNKNFDLFFEKYPKEKGEDKNVNNNKFSITREQMGRIYDVACGSWKEKLAEITRNKFPLFKDVTELDYKLVKSMFDAATTEQKPLLNEIFPSYKELTIIPKGEWAWVRNRENAEWLCRCSAGDGLFYLDQKTNGDRSVWMYAVPLNNRPF